MAREITNASAADFNYAEAASELSKVIAQSKILQSRKK